MILVTTGTQFPFDRMVSIIDHWAQRQASVEIYAQIGDSAFTPVNIDSCTFLSPEMYFDLIKKTTLIVAHAGMGSILTAYENGIPIIIMPRKRSLGEHRNDHQKSTAEKFKNTQGIYVAWDKKTLEEYLDNRNDLLPPVDDENPQSMALNKFITSYIA